MRQTRCDGARNWDRRPNCGCGRDLYVRESLPGMLPIEDIAFQLISSETATS